MKTRTQHCVLGVEGAPGARAELIALSSLLQWTHLAVGRSSGPCLMLTPHARTLFEVEGNDLRVSTRHAAELTRRTGLRAGQVYLVSALLALVQWRALQGSPLLVPEDFLHAVPPTCLFARRARGTGRCLAFARPHVCPACASFYACLGAERELEELQRVLTCLRKPSLN